ncbi:hypothetical protein ACS0TY_033522 [Phlomoides rotata]
MVDWLMVNMFCGRTSIDVFWNTSSSQDVGIWVPAVPSRCRVPDDASPEIWPDRSTTRHLTLGLQLNVLKEIKLHQVYKPGLLV